MLQKAADNRYEYSKIEERNKSESINKGRIILIYALVLLILGIFTVIYFSQSFQINALDQRINRLDNELSEIEAENQQYRLELAQSSSLSRIEKIAREEMNMREPQNTEIIVMKQDSPREEPVNNSERMFVIEFINDMVNKIGTVSAGSPE